MIDVLSFVIGGASVGIGALIPRRSRTPKAPRTAALVCSCDHGYGTHEHGGYCHGEQERPRWNSIGARTGFEYAPCPCRFYDGPEPLPRTWSPDEITGGTP